MRNRKTKKQRELIKDRRRSRLFEPILAALSIVIFMSLVLILTGV